MGRIFEVQAKNLDKFRRNHKRKLKKGDVIRIFGNVTTSTVTTKLDPFRKRNNILDSKNYTNKVIDNGVVGKVVEINNPK